MKCEEDGKKRCREHVELDVALLESEK